MPRLVNRIRAPRQRVFSTSTSGDDERGTRMATILPMPGRPAAGDRHGRPRLHALLGIAIVCVFLAATGGAGAKGKDSKPAKPAKDVPTASGLAGIDVVSTGESNGGWSTSA